MPKSDLPGGIRRQRLALLAIRFVWYKLKKLVQFEAVMLTVNIHDAKTQLSKLVDRAAQGEAFIIAKAGGPW